MAVMTQFVFHRLGRADDNVAIGNQFVIGQVRLSFDLAFLQQAGEVTERLRGHIAGREKELVRNFEPGIENPR